MGPFPSSFSHMYILLAVDYVSKWVEAISIHTTNASVVVKFLRSHIFTIFGTPRALITDGGTHFCNKLVDKVLKKYGETSNFTRVSPAGEGIGRGVKL